jgi:hypothetical protein
MTENLTEIIDFAIALQLLSPYSAGRHIAGFRQSCRFDSVDKRSSQTWPDI